MTRMHIIPRSLFAPLVGLVMLPAAGCDDFLAENPAGIVTTANFYQSEADAVAAVNAAYGQLLDGNYLQAQRYLELIEFPTPQLASRGGARGAGSCWDSLNCTADNQRAEAVWRGIYQAINVANAAIDNIPNVNMNAQLRDRLVAEAKFLRAFHYFNLVRGWGGVPLRVSETSSLRDLQQPRAKADEVYEQIIKDLSEAQLVLPLKSQYAANDWGRATRGAAQTLLGKVYLQRGVVGKSNPFGDPLYWPSARPDDISKAEAELRKVIQSRQYSLVANYGDLFQEKTERNSEVVWSVQNIAKRGLGSDAGRLFGPRNAPWGPSRWAWGNGELPFYESYEEGDVRREVTWLTEYTMANGKKAVWNRDNIFGDTYPYEGPAPEKYLVKREDIGDIFAFPTDLPVLRYADVMLMLAEALVEQGKANDEALQLVNQVRKRAGAAPLAGLDREVLYRERNWELATEQHGWYDAPRFWDLFTEQVHRHSMLGQTNPKRYPRRTVPPIEVKFEEPKDRLFPIPQDAIDRNPKLVQNPGW